MNEWEVKKHEWELEQQNGNRKICRIGIDIGCRCNMKTCDTVGNYTEIETNFLQSIKNLILQLIPIIFHIVIADQDKIKNKLTSNLFTSVFDNINEWYKIPIWNDTFWNVLNKPKITFVEDAEYFQVQTAEEI